MNSVARFEDLRCWQEARTLVKDIYKLRGHLDKDWGMRDQVRRASLSIMNNIAEGYGRFSDRDFSRFLKIAHASANEVKSMLYLLEDIEYFSTLELASIHEQVEKIKAQLLNFIRYLEKHRTTG